MVSKLIIINLKEDDLSKLIIINLKEDDLKEDDLRLCHRLETTSHFHWTQVTSLSIKVDVVVYVPGEGIRSKSEKKFYDPFP